MHVLTYKDHPINPYHEQDAAQGSTCSKRGAVGRLYTDWFALAQIGSGRAKRPKILLAIGGAAEGLRERLQEAETGWVRSWRVCKALQGASILARVQQEAMEGLSLRVMV